ncbi:uncharacterized protein PADG_01533 [Paracoccidioides brasiliensis Pb18]|uniref:Uncharacterized protein n=2 Tax=Paracoccidioides brasiliensis TaxID=121759 RepID=C1G3L7_PARBD|nr:uncharacterized protein PADG_01533 [Paracoccidioides brasiliensis Pb18]EEH45383.1 hypothetical protein PADG_01533 [Paracoccidioides brasiliensis Pb18]ODH44858.1 hypothetical protein ACO22_00622 [Paracoccidioides brasiliensis]
MSTIMCGAHRALINPIRLHFRSLTTLQGNPHIFVFPTERSLNGYILSLLPTDPPNPELAIGVTSKLPPTTDSFKENPAFLKTLQSVISEHAHEDPDVISQGQVMAFTSGANIDSGGMVFSSETRHSFRRGPGAAGLRENSTSGPNVKDSPSPGGRGGWIHISDTRNPPEYGRIAWPEDIFGSLEIDANGNIEGNYQPSGTYRIITRNGILGLSTYLREKLIQRLRSAESNS